MDTTSPTTPPQEDQSSETPLASSNEKPEPTPRIDQTPEAPRQETGPAASEKTEDQPKPSIEKPPAPPSPEQKKEIISPAAPQQPAAKPTPKGQTPTSQPVPQPSATLSADDPQKDQQIEKLLLLAVQDEKGKAKAIQEAEKIFKDDPHYLDKFHDQLISQNKK